MSQKTPSRAVSIRDVATLAGVSLGSASRVINNAENVTADTRDRVMRAIAELGYRPNHAARSLRLRTSRTIGVLFTDVTNPLYAKLFRALEERFLPEGYMLLLANGLNNPQREVDILTTFGSRGMDGVILAPGNERDPAVLAAIEALAVPAVILDRDIACDKDKVLFDHVGGLRGLVSYLADQGHRDIALVLGQTPRQPARRPMRRRIEGFQQGLKALGLAVASDRIVRLAQPPDSAFDAAARLLAGPVRPTALIAQGTHILNECLNAIHARQLSIPQDISVVTLGDPIFARTYLPPLTSLHMRPDRIADACARLLLARIRDGSVRAPQTLRITPELLERQSCGPAPEGAGMLPSQTRHKASG